MSQDPAVFKAEASPRALTVSRSVWPVVLVAAGAGLLTLNLLQIGLMNLLWPLFVLIPALVLLWPAHRSTANRPTGAGWLGLFGGLLATVAALLFLMNLTDHWEGWAYAWTLVPAGAVAGLMYGYRHQPERPIHRRGPRFIRLALTAGLAMALLFELFIFNTLGPWWPVLLVGLGLFLLVRRR